MNRVIKIDGWFVSCDQFSKGFMDYVVEIDRVVFSINHETFEVENKIAVTIWKGSGYEDTKHIAFFKDYEEAFAFVEEFQDQNSSSS